MKNKPVSIMTIIKDRISDNSQTIYNTIGVLGVTAMVLFGVNRSFDGKAFVGKSEVVNVRYVGESTGRLRGSVAHPSGAYVVLKAGTANHPDTFTQFFDDYNMDKRRIREGSLLETRQVFCYLTWDVCQLYVFD